VNIKSRHGQASQRSQEVDLALAVACCLVRPGECLSHYQIAEITGMSHGGSYMIEKRALKKLRLRLRYTSQRRIGRELVTNSP
jgi:hypothetical protein